jgi:hypothetical protein
MQGLAFEPTDEQRRTVRAMAGFGVPHEDIGTLLEIDAKTLRKHFRRELDRGSIEATAKVAQTLFGMATSGQNVAAAIFWMKARAGWREKHELVVSTRPVQELSDEELTEIIQQGRDRRTIEADPDEP